MTKRHDSRQSAGPGQRGISLTGMLLPLAAVVVLAAGCAPAEYPFYADKDGDSYGDPNDYIVATQPSAGYVTNSEDCNDNDAAINPGVAEIVGDGIDNDCNPATSDAALVTWYYDGDGDGYGLQSMSVEDYTAPLNYVADGTDCDDGNASINPGAAEQYNQVDDNCDGQVDEGFSPQTYYRDSDGDNYGWAGDTMVDISPPAGYVADNTDCDDSDASINPGEDEIYDGIDNNCNNQVDEGFNPVDWYRDADNDGYGNANDSTLDISQPAGYVADDSDCNDSAAAVNPGATEIYNSIDDNCDGQVDEGFSEYFRDQDTDGFGNAAISQFATSQPAGFVSDDTDCDDADINTYPGALELADGKDNDCDGSVDEGVVTWYRDADNDGYGNAGNTQQAVNQPGGFVADSSDCNDSNAAINPAATEVYNSVDDNCDGQVDEGFQTWYQDADADGYGNNANSLISDSQPGGYVLDNSDCNDGSAAINPGATEVYNSIDDNCDGQVDEGFSQYFQDSDGDGYGNAAVSQWATSQPANYVADSSDCNDGNANINPGATEQYNQVDDNCNGQVDEGFIENTYYQDADGDSYGNAAVSILDIAPPSGYVANSTDCNDGNAAVNPGATEVVNGIDDDCDGQTDEGAATYYRDQDADTYGDNGNSTVSIGQPAGYVLDNTDCNDTNAAINPGATEQYNGADDNCDGQVDEGFSQYFRDQDGDGYGNAAISQWATSQPSGYVSDSTDCNDGNGAVNPGASELYNSIDDNCDGQVDEGFSQYFRDQDGDGYGNAAVSQWATSQPSGYVTDNTDCNDSTAAANPGATEEFDGIDNDCDGLVDEGAVTYYRDQDGDNFGNAAVTQQAIGAAPNGYVADNTDCNDNDAAMFPGNPEIYDQKDNDCDGTVDNNFVAWYPDADSDGYGDENAAAEYAQSQPGSKVQDNSDCDDGRALTNPGATESENSIDDDCNGYVDNGFEHDWYADNDGDGHGAGGVIATESAYYQPLDSSLLNDDCNDMQPLAYPGNPTGEVPYDGIDNDCNPATPDEPVLSCVDQVIEITYNLGPNSYTVSGTSLGAGDGTNPHENTRFVDGQPSQRTITVRYDDVDKDGIPDQGGRADIVNFDSEIDMKVGTNVLGFIKGTVFTEIRSWTDDRSATGAEISADDLPATLIPGTLSGSTVSLTNGKLINYKTQGWVRCVSGNDNAAYLGDPGVLADPDGSPTGTLPPQNVGSTSGTICGAAGVGWQNDPAINPNLASFSITAPSASSGTIQMTFQIASTASTGSNDISYGKPGNVTFNITGSYAETNTIVEYCQ